MPKVQFWTIIWMLTEQYFEQKTSAEGTVQASQHFPPALIFGWDSVLYRILYSHHVSNRIIMVGDSTVPLNGRSAGTCVLSILPASTCSELAVSRRIRPKATLFSEQLWMECISRVNILTPDQIMRKMSWLKYLKMVQLRTQCWGAYAVAPRSWDQHP